MSTIWLVFAIACVLVSCTNERYERYERLSGPTMGTQYRVVARCESQIKGTRIESVLERVNASMSTYDAGSELSKINAAPVGEWMTLSPELTYVMSAAIDLSLQSDGAFDMTVLPLVNAWGFGAFPLERAPTNEILDEARKRVGFRKIVLEGRKLRKNADVEIDLSAIAKGFGVDAVAAELEMQNCSDFMIEIGGEVQVAGVNPAGRSWRIAIEGPDGMITPLTDRILELTSGSVATSGDYRNLVKWNGVTYSHTIDPRLGAPISHPLASVTVLHESAMWADGFATLINVLGPKAGLNFAVSRNVPAYLIVRRETGFTVLMTPAMAVYFE
jgi:thiamine biosynthesis lipoprotein